MPFICKRLPTIFSFRCERGLKFTKLNPYLGALSSRLPTATSKAAWVTPNPPILCTGFTGSLSKLSGLFYWSDGNTVLNEFDESTRTPGLFVVGPSVRHEQVIFCFIYKFRQRFAVLANAIAQRLGLDSSNFRGTTVACETYQDGESLFVDTPLLVYCASQIA